VTSQKTPPSFQIGQCWTSEGEPELGIGFVRAIDETSVALEFPSGPQGRLYRKRNAPLRRLEFSVGEKIQSKAGTSLLIHRVEERDHLHWYISKSGQEICESELSPSITIQRPLERFLSGAWDPLKSFTLRRRSLELWHEHQNSDARGMIGPRALFLPHQLYVTHEICNRGFPRALLADEVGLGKTIEAGWIMHRLLQTGRARRVLVIAPESLINQWFVELFRRFNLSFWVPSSQTDEDLEADDLENEERVLLSLESLVKMKESGVLANQTWDLLIVDEAHRVQWSEDAASPEYQIISDIAERSRGLLLLTATPEQLGVDGHFSRLKLIDPQRFPSLKKFKEEHSRYQEVSRLAESLIEGLTTPSGKKTKKAISPDLKKLKTLLAGKVPSEAFDNLEDPEARRNLALLLNDYYGTGRVTFRNARSVIEVEDFSFPKRILEPHLITPKEDETRPQALSRWLSEFAIAHKTEKSVLICSSAKKVSEWEKKLRDENALKVVAFHEGLSLLARDRNAAYFDDPKGATLLLCSEIGGEGRNFQAAAHLVLPDLPEDPDLLEQRIGRLDRIGQLSDIHIHVPYFEGSREEQLLKWHRDVFDAFSAPPKGARSIYEKYSDALQKCEDKPKTLSKLLTTAHADYLQGLEEIESGRDRLIELNSFHPEKAAELSRHLKEAEKTEILKEHLEDLFDAFRITSDTLDSDTLFVEPGHSQYAAYFPGLTSDGMSFTFSRQKALARNDLTFMSWDHPMVAGAFDSILRQEFGNVSVAAWPNQLLVIECTFLLETSVSDPGLYADEFLSPTPIRLILEATGKDLTQEWDWEKLKPTLTAIPESMIPMIRKLPGERIRGVLKRAQSEAQSASLALRTEAVRKLREKCDFEMNRLKSLQEKNQLVSAAEIQWWADRKGNLEKVYEAAQVRLDSFLLIVPSRLGN
jgi:ATP-dependent helicase HepA